MDGLLMVICFSVVSDTVNVASPQESENSSDIDRDCDVR